MQQLRLRKFIEVRQALFEDVCVDHGRGATRVAHQYAVIAQESEQLACWRRKEFANRPVLQYNPFRVGAGQAEQPAFLAQIPLELQCTENLRLLTAQKIRCVEPVAARQTGNY